MTRRFRIVNSWQPKRQFDAADGRASASARQVVTNEIPDRTLHPHRASQQEADRTRDELEEIRDAIAKAGGDQQKVLEAIGDIHERKAWVWARISGSDQQALSDRITNQLSGLLVDLGLDGVATVHDLWVVTADTNERVRNLEDGQTQLSTREDVKRLESKLGLGPDYGDVPWRQFVAATDEFREESGVRFMLIVDSVRSAENTTLDGLGMVPWTAVIDFDREPDSGGLFAAIQSTLSARRTILRVAGDQTVPLHARDQTLWIHACGYEGARSTLDEGNFRSWNRVQTAPLERIIQSVAHSISPGPIICVVAWNDESTCQYIDAFLAIVDRVMGDLMRYVFVSDTESPLAGPAATYGEPSTYSQVLPIRLQDLAIGLTDLLKSRGQPVNARCVIPTSSGAPFDIHEHERIWLEQELEIVHEDVGLEGPDDPESYRRGAGIRWRDLNLNHDCRRDIHEQLLARVEQDLRERRSVRINLMHAPGAGGTTVARRVLWELRKKFPCTALRQLLEPSNTLDRLRWIQEQTQHSQLLLIDGSEFGDGDVEELYEALGAQQLPVVMLIVSRQFALSSSKGTGKRSFRLRAELDPNELDRFVTAYAASRMDRREALDQLRTTTQGERKTAFYVGLVTYGRDFVGLADYVSERLNGMTSVQRKIVTYLAFAHHFGQQALPAQSFAGLLQVPRNRTVNLSKFVSTKTCELLFAEEAGSWRTIHDLIAEETLHRVLSSGGPKERWTDQLSTWAKDFAHFLRGEWQVLGTRISDLAQRIFVYRDNSRILGTEMSSRKEYSQLVERIPTTEGKLELLRELTKAFPEEAHFHAHLGRFCGQNNRFDEATAALEMAVALEEEDPVLHHMRGMIYRYRLAAESDRVPPATLDTLVDLAKQAGESFERSRKINPENEYGYISEVQMLIKLVDHAGKLTGGNRIYAFSPDAHPFLREAMDTAETLLDQARIQRGGGRPSNFELDCRGRLDTLYGNDHEALQAWDSILTRDGMTRKPPIRRQIVRTLLRREDGDWEKMKQKSRDRCVSLLQENLGESPEDGTSLRMWLRAVRHASTPPSVEAVLEKISIWRSLSDSLDAAFYQFVLQSLLAMDGSVLSMTEADRAMHQSQELSRYRKRRTWSYEWLGRGDGIRQLVHQFELGDWDEDLGFYSNVKRLQRVRGHVRSMGGPQKGSIEIESGQEVFFVPAKTSLVLDRDLNRRVTFFLGFSYDGLRAWDVMADES